MDKPDPRASTAGALCGYRDSRRPDHLYRFWAFPYECNGCPFLESSFSPRELLAIARCGVRGLEISRIASAEQDPEAVSEWNV